MTVVQEPYPAPTPVTPPSTDTCGADQLQQLLGRPRSEIPVAVDMSHRRVTCTTCPITEDFSPARLNIFFDASTDLVAVVRCG